MKGYVARKGNRYYAVIYEGTDPSPAAIADAGIPPAPTRMPPKHWHRISPIDTAGVAVSDPA